MTTSTHPLPIAQTLQPKTQDEIALAIREAYASQTPIYPVGGGTALDFGFVPKAQGILLETAKLDRVIEYAARDMTITLEAGCSMSSLSQRLMEENQELPVDVPNPEQATLGGVIATAFDGPRRYGLGQIRDYVIGISAVDGKGMEFQAGGRVVKNVAGYDFCKLLTGSMGTLGVITQLTLRVRPIPEARGWIIGSITEFSRIEPILASLAQSKTTPCSIELLTSGTSFSIANQSPKQIFIAVEIQGTQVEFEWMQGQLIKELRANRVENVQMIEGRKGQAFSREIVQCQDNPASCFELKDHFQESPTLSAKVSVPSSKLVTMVERVLKIDPKAFVLSHAGSGVLLVHFCGVDTATAANFVVQVLRPNAIAEQGSVVVLRGPAEQMTRQDIWGPRTASQLWMERIKEQFDPRNILNPERFVF